MSEKIMKQMNEMNKRTFNVSNNATRYKKKKENKRTENK